MPDDRELHHCCQDTASTPRTSPDQRDPVCQCRLRATECPKERNACEARPASAETCCDQRRTFAPALCRPCVQRTTCAWLPLRLLPHPKVKRSPAASR